MAQVWKVVEFKDRSTTIVPSSWLEEAGESWNCFWPPSSYDHNRLQKAVAHHLPPGAAWDVHGDVRVLVSCATYVKAKDYLKKSLLCLTSDIQSEAEDPIRRKKRPNSRYLQEPAGRVQTTTGPPQHFFEGVDTDDEAPPPPRKTARQSVDVGPDINSEWLFGPSTTQRAQSNGSQRLELLHLDTVQPSHQLLHDMGISKVVELLSKVLEENKLMKAEITNLGSEVRALRREMVRPVAPEAAASSIKLPLRTMEEFQLAEAVMRETPCEKQKMILTFSLIGGHTAEEAVRRMLQSGLTNNLACRFNWAGKGFKEAFKSTVLSDVLFAALQKQLPGTTHIVFSGTLKKWLKYAPEREGGGGRRTNERDQVGLCTLVPHTMRPSTDERRECDSEPWTGLNGRTQNAFRERNAMEPVSCHNSNLKKKVSKSYTLKFKHL
ncbi:uncharacterized protein LOC115558791 isoform X2 [Gadus morhua]|nr:uncharacterized protein LOC115558791 isoform X2 [Gadus morhua]XP_030233111.1 uncharacterized protein LOC115558791 isoform X2 [Gadus morhua]XP_030233112.1 uncharacterized protein LOC115558791 isoform X2 [Gadus morhua]